MVLAPGTRLGVYEVLSLEGAGGMGEVYRARDSKLGRDVAIKVLAPGFTTDPERLARFRREAHVLASLNHPNIGSIYGFEDSGDVAALILELVEGETLADRVASGPLPVGDATRVPARQRWQPQLAITALLIGIASIAAGAWLWTRQDSQVKPTALAIERVAILPLENLSGDTAEDFFADGVTEALTTELAQISALSVIARDSVMRFKGSTKTSSEIAAELGVDAVIRGTVIHGGDSVRIEKAHGEHDLEGMRMQSLRQHLGSEPRFQALYRAFDPQANRK